MLTFRANLLDVTRKGRFGTPAKEMGNQLSPRASQPLRCVREFKQLVSNRKWATFTRSGSWEMREELNTAAGLPSAQQKVFSVCTEQIHFMFTGISLGVNQGFSMKHCPIRHSLPIAGYIVTSPISRVGDNIRLRKQTSLFRSSL